MKKTWSILLLLMLLFNWVGYRFLIAALERDADQSMDLRLDSGAVDISRLLTVKVQGVHLTGYVLSTGFERIHGQVEIGGMVYQYIQRKFFGDTLEFICLPNPAATRLQSAKQDLDKWAAGMQQHTGKKQGMGIVWKTTSEYLSVSSAKIAEHDYTQAITWLHTPIFLPPMPDRMPIEYPPEPAA